jgi:alkanesulfonate monooxygenase SsuD/methylene tetrahydromethanopterin reductase-like flavin-dependent oxidoreductase (luciferase family)
VTVYGVHAGTEGASIAEVLSFWRKVESLGYGWISVWDHFLPMSASTGSFESVSSHAALACTAQRVRVGVLVYAVGYRHPAVLANAISTIDHLSRGRADVAIGAGWAEAEYHAYGIPFPLARERLDQMEEALQCLAGLLHNERFNFQGRHFHLTDAALGVRPLQARVPLWVGGVGEKRVLPMAARYADGWDAPLQPSPKEFAHKVQVLERACEDIGRDPASIHRSAHVAVVEDEAQARARFGDQQVGGVVWGSDGRVLDFINSYVEAGADQVLIAGALRWGADQIERAAGLLKLR